MSQWNRRRFLKGALLPAALGTLPACAARGAEADGGGDSPPNIIDTNVHLFDWPFRKLKYAGAKPLVAKLRKHRIKLAWAGSYEGLLHKNLEGVACVSALLCAAGNLTGNVLTSTAPAGGAGWSEANAGGSVQMTNALIRLISSTATPMTAASDTAGWRTRHASTSAGETQRPPTLIMSSARPW